MTDPLLRQLEDELARLRHLRDATLAILQDSKLDPGAKLQALERAFQGERDDEEEAEEAKARERLS